MKDKKKYYKDIDLIRILACVSVLLYHLNILKGGYLAVCTFFVLSGYLSFISVAKKEKFSLPKYYYNRILKLYLPLILVVFITVFFTSLLPNFTWLNLKPEVTSILLGYNNFWQLGASLDYFARHINSPFMHLWYIAILIQFDLVFPFIYMFIKKVKEKSNTVVPLIIMILASIFSFGYFYKINLDGKTMVAYYDTFARIFSLLLGVLLGFVHTYYKSYIKKSLSKGINGKFVFYGYLLILLILFIFLPSTIGVFMPFGMLIVSFITCRLIDYATFNASDDLSIFSKAIKSLSGVSYEVYLFQYPVIFMFQYISFNVYLKIILIVVITLILSYLVHFSISYSGNDKRVRVINFILNVILFGVYLCGISRYIMAHDYTKEMESLEEELAQNSLIVQERQEEYAKKIQNEEDEWQKKLESLEINEEEIRNLVSNLNVVGIGDSVMLGAVQNLYEQFPNGYFDAETSRTAWVVNGIIQNLKNNNLLGNPVVLNLGVNGDCSLECKKEIIETLDGHKIFWVNVNNGDDFGFNKAILELANEYTNLYVIDWENASRGHPEYFIADGIHLTSSGRDAYTKTIFNAIYDVYLKEYEDKRNAIVSEHEEQKKEKITFYGNDLLLGAFDYMQKDFSNAKFITDNEFDYDKLKEELAKEMKDNSLTYNLVFIFDSTAKLTSKEYSELIELYNDYKIYIVNLYDNLSDVNYDNAKVIDFNDKLSSFLMADKVHLTADGNKYLANILKDNLLMGN